eukprot:Em0073g22a
MKAYVGRSQGRKKARDQDASSVGKWVTFLATVQSEGHYFGERKPRNGVRDPEQDRTVFVYQVEGKKTKILLDTGCSRTMVSNQLVPLENYLEGKGVSVRCAHGDINFYPLAKVEIGVKDLKLIVEAAVAENPTVPVLLGTDVPELFQLLGRQPEETCPQDVLIVMTRARARQQLEEEILRKEKERAAGARPRSIEESSNGSPTLSSEVPKREDPVEPKSKGILDISADELQRLQENDSTLANIRQMVADEARKGEDSEYFMKDGLLSRRWAPYGRKEFEIEQLVLPKQLRRTVLELAHDISRNWRSKGLRGIRSLRNSMSIENVWTHSENCS